MDSIFKAWKTIRQQQINYFNNYTLEQLNLIPKGFNNNLIWNLGHIIVAQQSLVYTSSDLPLHIPNELLNLYQPGTKPNKKVGKSEADELKNLLTSLIDLTEKDFNEGNFKTFKPRVTLTGFRLDSLKDTLEFNNYHEGLHLGVMMCIRKFI